MKTWTFINSPFYLNAFSKIINIFSSCLQGPRIYVTTSMFNICIIISSLYLIVLYLELSPRSRIQRSFHCGCEYGLIYSNFVFSRCCDGKSKFNNVNLAYNYYVHKLCERGFIINYLSTHIHRPKFYVRIHLQIYIF